ncbi:cofilin/actin-depolymerizing factor homolog [Drosophila ficusphila]|uniref:cofilin/actin-depolymerizing factor homolog n=1 Tax=Drosophila ficusphila TaxID=30025 RepID=UPI0007E872E3|nr:cofilin/actin-depolymerizing factor homolog [Drosophila ficusphila]
MLVGVATRNELLARMASGIDVSRECKQIFDQIRRMKRHRYAIFDIREEREIKVEWLGVREASYDDFLQDLRRAGANQCRFAVYDYSYQHQCQGASSTCLKERLFLMLWCPTLARIKDKMLYSSTFAVLKREFPGVQKCIQATDLDEACRNAVEEQLRSLDRE